VLEDAGEARLMPVRCRSCNAPITWAIVEGSQAAMPLDAQTHPKGNVYLTHNRDGTPVARVLTDEERAEYPGDLHLSHFATCPHADDWRRRR
jgi:hypothetical protein